jgi:hypothetical protein
VNGRAVAVSRRTGDRKALARGHRRLALALFAVVFAAAGAAACGGSSSVDVAPYLGVWQRVVGGVPDPAVTLTVARQDDGCTVTLADLVSGRSETVSATVGDGYLACTLPAPDHDVQLSLDDNGQLVVDRVLADGTLEPVWLYDRPASAPAGP